MLLGDRRPCMYMRTCPPYDWKHLHLDANQRVSQTRVEHAANVLQTKVAVSKGGRTLSVINLRPN